MDKNTKFSSYLPFRSPNVNEGEGGSYGGPSTRFARSGQALRQTGGELVEPLRASIILKVVLQNKK